MYSIFSPPLSAYRFSVLSVFLFASLSFLYLYLLIACLTFIFTPLVLSIPARLSLLCLVPLHPSFWLRRSLLLLYQFFHFYIYISYLHSLFVFSAAYLSLSSLTVFLFLRFSPLYLSISLSLNVCFYASISPTCLSLPTISDMFLSS